MSLGGLIGALDKLEDAVKEPFIRKIERDRTLSKNIDLFRIKSKITKIAYKNHERIEDKELQKDLNELKQLIEEIFEQYFKEKMIR